MSGREQYKSGEMHTGQVNVESLPRLSDTTQKGPAPHGNCLSKAVTAIRDHQWRVKLTELRESNAGELNSGLPEIAKRIGSKAPNPFGVLRPVLIPRTLSF